MVVFAGEGLWYAGHAGELLEVLHQQGAPADQSHPVLLPGWLHTTCPLSQVPRRSQLHLHRLVHGVATRGSALCLAEVPQ